VSVRRTFPALIATLTAAVLVAGCTTDPGVSAGDAPGAATGVSSSAATRSATSAAESTSEAAGSAESVAPASTSEAVSALDPASARWYESFCSAVGEVILQGGPQYTAASTTSERTGAYIDWLTDITTRTTESRAALKALDPADSVADGAKIHTETLAALEEVTTGAKTSRRIFTGGTPVEDVPATDPAWAELALRPYSTGVDRLNEMVSAHADALLPPERVHQIEAIGDCGTLLEVH